MVTGEDEAAQGLQDCQPCVWNLVTTQAGADDPDVGPVPIGGRGSRLT